MKLINNITNLAMAIQVRLVQKYFPHFRVVRTQENEAYLEGWVHGDENSLNYLLRLYFNPLLPEVCPALYVWDPLIVPRNPSGRVNDFSMSHEFHTRENGPEGRVQICHTAPSDWDASVTYVLPILKGYLWCAAHSAHMKDGSPISTHFK